MAGHTGSTLRIAVAHDWLVGYRGGEAVLESILKVASSLGDVDAIYTMFDAGKPLAPHIDHAEHVRSSLSSWGTPVRRWLLPLYHLAVENLSDTLASRHRERPIDLLISTSSAAILGIVPPPGIPHLCYLHAPARYLWSQSEEYAKHSLAVALGLGLLGDKLRNIDRARASTISRLLANSSAIAAEAKRVYGLHATVVHPGVRTEYFTPPSKSRRNDQWLIVGALEPYKRVDLAIHAANATGHTLLVVGRGSCIRQLRTIAGPTVQFLGHVDDEGLRELYRTSRVLLFPQIEDFGIVAVEAQACGLPVVGRAAGGALDTVIDGVTGSLFSEPSTRALLEAIARAPAPDSVTISQNAARFSVPRFEGLIKSHVLQLLSEQPDRPRD